MKREEVAEGQRATELEDDANVSTSAVHPGSTLLLLRFRPLSVSRESSGNLVKVFSSCGLAMPSGTENAIRQVFIMDRQARRTLQARFVRITTGHASVGHVAFVLITKKNNARHQRIAKKFPRTLYLRQNYETIRLHPHQPHRARPS